MYILHIVLMHYMNYLNIGARSKNKSKKGLPLEETKNTQNHENRRLGLIESLHMQHCGLRGCICPPCTGLSGKTLKMASHPVIYLLNAYVFIGIAVSSSDLLFFFFISGGIVPFHMTTNNGTKDLIVAVADNWDHNENTLSGKQSTHAMTSILVKSSQTDSHASYARITRVADRSIDTASLPGIN